MRDEGFNHSDTAVRHRCRGGGGDCRACGHLGRSTTSQRSPAVPADNHGQHSDGRINCNAGNPHRRSNRDGAGKHGDHRAIDLNPHTNQHANPRRHDRYGHRNRDGNAGTANRYPHRRHANGPGYGACTANSHARIAERGQLR